ncbi:hypothetical protein CASFOL_039503 [Castilleja foliolosa]|uniref:Uncharacterized protein n=1 Tax=Castilleja foliolosa TaxID=1961234 RepID=A0ABD3BIS2_9LAMI
MSIALRTKLRSLSAAYLLRSLPSSIDCSSGISTRDVGARFGTAFGG